MKLVAAEGAMLERVLDLTYPLWHEGLTREAYGRWNAAQMRTEWGSRHLQRLALIDATGALLSSAKRYRLRAVVDGRAVPVCGIGAVFTPIERRGRGHAGALVERLVEAEQARGAAFAALFTEIGPAFYERLGFRSVPIDEVTIDVARKAGAPAMLVRAGHDSDLPALASMHEARAATSRMRLARDPSLIHFALAKKRLLAGLGPMGLRQVEFHVVEEGASAVAYVILSTSAHGWTLDECGDRDPAGARLGALLQVLMAREPSQRPPIVRAWWPRAFQVPPQLALRDRTDARDVFMLRPLGEIAVPSAPGDAFYWRGDFF